MPDKSFVTISRKECQSRYKEIITVSDKHWETSQKMAEAENYGLAMILLIASIEELVKALIIFFDANGFDLRKVKGMNKFFKDHQIRYFIAYIMFIMNIVIDEFKKIIIQYYNRPEDLMQLVKQAKSDETFFEKHLKFYLLRKLILVKKELEWFEKIDLSRQQSLYSDYQGKFSSPVTIGKADYDEALAKLEKVRLVGKGIIEGLELNEYKDHLEMMKKQFKEGNYYRHMELALHKLNQEKSKPFKMLRTQINDAQGGVNGGV